MYLFILYSVFFKIKVYLRLNGHLSVMASCIVTLDWKFGLLCCRIRLSLCHKLRAYFVSPKNTTEAQVRHLAGPREFSREITRWRERFHTGSLLITADVCQRECCHMLNVANMSILLSSFCFYKNRQKRSLRKVVLCDGDQVIIHNLHSTTNFLSTWFFLLPKHWTELNGNKDHRPR